jgi:hypothetical protein
MRSAVIRPFGGVRGLRCEEVESASLDAGTALCGSMAGESKKLQSSPAQSIRLGIETT